MDESLQFSKAEYADNTPKCAACRAALETQFFQLAGHNICANCAEAVRKNQQRPSHSAVMRGILYGAGAAFVCFLGYATLIWVTGLEIGLVAIAIGYFVGRSVRIGSYGLGGRRCQVAAVALTYCSLAFSGLPAGIRDYLKSPEVQEERQKAAAAKRQAQTPQATAPDATPPVSQAGAGGGFVGLIAAVAVLSGIALASPFLGLASGVGGILGIAIIGFGLQRAWMLTARDSRALTGPFERQTEAPVG